MRIDKHLKISIYISVVVIICILAYAFIPINDIAFIYNEF